MKEDKHHCRCHTISKEYINTLRNCLEREGFYDASPLQEDHGQIWGLIKKLGDFWQMHVKVMREGLIEAEIEPRHAYPLEHLDQQNSFSGHNHVGYYLKKHNIPYRARIAPIGCLMPGFKKPTNPMHVSALALIVGVIVATVVAVVAIGERK